MNTFQPIGQVAAEVVNRWAWWQEALKGNFGPASESHPEQGYYRTRRKGGQWEAVAIWWDEESGKWLGYRGGQEARDVNELWVWSMRYPITADAYDKAMAGGGFDDEPPAPLGHNSGDADPFEALRIELAGEMDTAADFLKQPVATQAEADKIGIWAKRVGEIAKRAEQQRVVEKEPHLAASRAVDTKWRPVIDDAKDFGAKLKRHVEPFLIAEKRKAEEAARKAREEAERQRAAAQAEQDAERRAAALQAAQEAEKVAEPKNASAGRTGARVSIRTEKRARIVDFDACLAALKTHKDLIALVEQLAQRAVKAGVSLAGVEVEEVEKAV